MKMRLIKFIFKTFLQYVNKIIDEYLDVMNESSIIMYINFMFVILLI